MGYFWFVTSLVNILSVVSHAYCYEFAVDNGYNRQAIVHVLLMAGCGIAGISSATHI